MTRLMKDRILDFYSPKNALVDAHIFVASVSFFMTCETRTHLLQKEELPCSDRNPQPLSMLRLWMNTGCFKKRSIHLKNNEHLFLSFSGCNIRRWTFVYNRHVSLWYTAGICTHHASGVIQGLATRAAGHHQMALPLCLFGTINAFPNPCLYVMFLKG